MISSMWGSVCWKGRLPLPNKKNSSSYSPSQHSSSDSTITRLGAAFLLFLATNIVTELASGPFVLGALREVLALDFFFREGLEWSWGSSLWFRVCFLGFSI
jgi:hypothetical protein